MLRRRCTWCTWCVRYILSLREPEHLGRRDDVQLERFLTELSTGTVCYEISFLLLSHLNDCSRRRFPPSKNKNKQTKMQVRAKLWCACFGFDGVDAGVD